MKKALLFLSLINAFSSFSQSYYASYSNDNQKYTLRDIATDNLVDGGKEYSRINVYNRNYFACSLADTIFKGNCTLLDSSLKTVIPYGLFSEIVLSDDGNYATVAGEEYTLTMRQYAYDTVSINVKSKDWGLYDLKAKKITLLINYNYLGKVYNDGIMVFNTGGRGYMNDRFGQGGKFGLINTKGEIVCKPKYTYIGSFNEKGIAIAVVGGDNLDGVNGGYYISINKKGENTKPNFCIESSPVLAKIKLPAESSFIMSKELQEFMHFNNNDDSLTRTKLFNEKYQVDVVNQEDVFYDNEGNETIIYNSIYPILEKDSWVDIWQPLPANYKYYYNPMDVPVKNWGKYVNHKTNVIPTYEVINSSVETPVAVFYTIDSVYAAEYDSLELDYMYPGIYDQNKKVLSKKFYQDIGKRKSKVEDLYDQGFVFDERSLDTIRYKYKLTCDTVETKLTICNYCDSEEAKFATKYYYRKKTGLLINEMVVVPPLYDLVIRKSGDDYLLLDTNHVVWNFNLKSNAFTKSNLKFNQIITRRWNREESRSRFFSLLSLKDEDNRFVVYGIETPGTMVVFDSIKASVMSGGVDIDGNEVSYTAYSEFNSDYYDNGETIVFRSDSAYTYDVKTNTIVFKDKISNLFAGGYWEGRPDFIDKPITMNHVKYKSYYYQRGLYLLETSNRNFIYSNNAFFTTNSIKADSVVQVYPYLIYKSNQKMYLATFKSKPKKVKNKKVDEYFISILDSAKRIVLIDKYDTYDARYYERYEYSNVPHDLYEADGIYKSISMQKPVIYVPTNFKNCEKKEVKLVVDDKERAVLKPSVFYVIKNKNKEYLCKLVDGSITKDSLDFSIVASYTDEMYEVLDSAKSFEIPVTDIYSINYKAKGTYKADGVLRSTNSFKSLPAIPVDSISLLQTDDGLIEAYAICKNKTWKIVCVNLSNPAEYIILDQFQFKSLQELRKALYPYRVSYNVCNTKTERQVFKEKLTELNDNVLADKRWK